MKAIKTDKAPAAIGPYSQAVDLGYFVYTSGQLPINMETGRIPDGIRDQTEQVMENIKAVLAAAGLSMKDVVKTLVFLADIKDFDDMNTMYARYFEAPCPARSCVQVAAIPKGAKLEIECIARRK